MHKVQEKDSHAKVLARPHYSTSDSVCVHKTSLALPSFIVVSVPSQKRVNGHVCVCSAYRFLFHFYFCVLLIESWNCPSGIALICFSYLLLGKFLFELYHQVFNGFTLLWSLCLISLVKIISYSDPLVWYVARTDITQHRKWGAIEDLIEIRLSCYDIRLYTNKCIDT